MVVYVTKCDCAVSEFVAVVENVVVSLMIVRCCCGRIESESSSETDFTRTWFLGCVVWA